MFWTELHEQRLESELILYRGVSRKMEARGNWKDRLHQKNKEFPLQSHVLTGGLIWEMVTAAVHTREPGKLIH